VSIEKTLAARAILGQRRAGLRPVGMNRGAIATASKKTPDERLRALAEQPRRQRTEKRALRYPAGACFVVSSLLRSQREVLSIETPHSCEYRKYGCHYSRFAPKAKFDLPIEVRLMIEFSQD